MYVLLSSKNKAHTHPKHDYILISLIINNFTFHFTQRQECETFVAGEALSCWPSSPSCHWMSGRPNVAFMTAPSSQLTAHRVPTKIDGQINCLDSDAHAYT